MHANTSAPLCKIFHNNDVILFDLGWAAFTVSLSLSTDKMRIHCVVESDSWPKSSCTTVCSPPRSSVAYVCLMAWGESELSSPAAKLRKEPPCAKICFAHIIIFGPFYLFQQSVGRRPLRYFYNKPLDNWLIRESNSLFTRPLPSHCSIFANQLFKLECTSEIRLLLPACKTQVTYISRPTAVEISLSWFQSLFTSESVCEFRGARGFIIEREAGSVISCS